MGSKEGQREHRGRVRRKQRHEEATESRGGDSGEGWTEKLGSNSVKGGGRRRREEMGPQSAT